MPSPSFLQDPNSLGLFNMKQRFTYLDLKVIKNELQEQILNYRLQNIYDLAASSRQFLFKFQVPTSKKNVFVDPGFRIHLTEYSRSTAAAPSGFVAKLRKHLKTRRLTKLSIAPADRTLVLSFSDDHAYHLVIEYFAGGNLLLLNNDHKILALQRVVSATDSHSRCAVGEIYDISSILNSPDGASESPIDLALLKDILHGKQIPTSQNQNEGTFGTSNELSNKKKEKNNLKRLLSMKLPTIAVGVLENCLTEVSVNPSLSSTKFNTLSEDDLHNILEAVNKAQKTCAELVNRATVPGYIVAHKKKEQQPVVELTTYAPDQKINDDLVYEDFVPFKPTISEKDGEVQIIETASYNEAVDKYFSVLEATKLSQRFSNQELSALRKLEAAKSEKQKRVSGLTQVKEKNEILGTALQLNAERVEEACDAVKVLINQGMDWTDIEKLIKVEKSRGNPVANMIAQPLNLQKNRITLILPDPNATEQESDSDSDLDLSDNSEDESDSGRESTPAVQTVKAEVDLNLTAWANSRKYFEIRKSAVAKQERTVAQADAAYKRAEKKIQHDLKKSLEKDKGRQTDLQWVRNPFWFEKFYWFPTSDGYLCISGRDAVQNELLLQRYFQKNDILVHSEVEGSSIVIIKNYSDKHMVPPSTLTQAGIFAVASSQKAWDAKLITSAWWATRDQIPLLSAQGEPITADFLVVNGEGKHFLPAVQLDMGLGFLWLIADESKDKYPRNKAQSLNRGDGGSSVVVHSGSGSDEDSDEEFPDTQVLSDDEDFPDTQVDFDDEDADEDDDIPVKHENISTDQRDTISSVTEDLSSEDEADEENADLPLPQEHAEDNISDDDFQEEDVEEGQDIENGVSNDGEGDEQKEDDEKEGATDHVSEIEAALSALQTGRRKVRDTTPPKESKNKKNKKEPKLKGLDKAKSKKEEAAKKKHDNEIKRREKAKQAKAEQLKRVLNDEGNEALEAEMSKYPLDVLQPKLVPRDEPLAAVPVFGPWQSLQKLKYKVKIQPGANKKGKAVKDIMHSLQNLRTDKNGLDPDYPWATEVNHLRGLKETSVILCIAVGKVKISIPGTGNGAGPKKGGKDSGKGGKGKKR